MKSFSFFEALRPFSLVVAVVSCGLGVKLAAPQGALQTGLAVVVILAGLLLQCGVNLINDKADLHLLMGNVPEVKTARRRIHYNFRAGLICFAAAIAIGIYIAMLRGLSVVEVGLIGVLGAYAYTQEPFNYKRRGLGLVFVFLLMGVLMVQGAYLAISGGFSLSVVWHSLPISCLVSLLLLSNELRDWEKDTVQGTRTLTVRIGFTNAIRLYWILIAATYLLSGVLLLNGDLSRPYWLLLPLPLLAYVIRYLNNQNRAPLTSWTGRFLLLFGIGYGLALP